MIQFAMYFSYFKLNNIIAKNEEKKEEMYAEVPLNSHR